MANVRTKGRGKPGGGKATGKRPGTAKQAGPSGGRARTKIGAVKQPVRRVAVRAVPAKVDPAFFGPLSEGERADAVRVMLEDERLHGMAKVGRYRVLAAEPLVAKPPHELAGRRLGRVVIYDYASDQSVDGCVDLEAGTVCTVTRSAGQPPLCAEEEAAALAIASADGRVAEAAGGASPSSVLHYWSRRREQLASRRRSAAVLFGPAGERPTLVVVVDLVDRTVLETVSASEW